MAEYSKDKRFSVGWVIGGAVIMAVTAVFGSFIVKAVGVPSVYVAYAIVAACYALGGFVVGWQSEGSTIIEAGLAALLATGAQIAIAAFSNNGFSTDPEALGLGVGLPIVGGIIGSIIGEKVQGDVIRTQD
jgi:hypothetical protein